MKKTVLFTADTHFSHGNVIKYCSRPFSSADEMNEVMIERWNSVVKQHDTVYHVGDVIFLRNEDAIIDILKQLNGEIHLVCGNHDRHLRSRALNYFASVEKSGLKEIKIQDSDASRGIQLIVLCHYAMRSWNASHYGAWQLFGHSHGTLPDDPNALSLDVGVDCHNFYPISYEQIKERMKLKKFIPIDHHKGKET